MANAPNPNVPQTIPSDWVFGPPNLTTTSQSTPANFLQGPFQTGANQLANTYYPGGSLAPYPFPNQQTATFDPLQLYGQILGGQQALQNAPLSGTANSLAEATMGGAFLYPQSNPWLDATFNQAAQGVSDVYKYSTAPSTQAEFARAGAFGGSAQNQTREMQQFGLGQNLNDLATQIYGGNYQAERARQQAQQVDLPILQQFGATIPNTINNIGQQRQQMLQSLYNTGYQNQMQRAQYPFQSAQDYIKALSQLSGAAGGTQSQTSMNPNYNPLGTLLMLQQLSQSNQQQGPSSSPILGALAGSLAPALLGSVLGGQDGQLAY